MVCRCARVRYLACCRVIHAHISDIHRCFAGVIGSVLADGRQHGGACTPGCDSNWGHRLRSPPARARIASKSAARQRSLPCDGGLRSLQCDADRCRRRLALARCWHGNRDRASPPEGAFAVLADCAPIPAASRLISTTIWPRTRCSHACRRACAREDSPSGDCK